MTSNSGRLLGKLTHGTSASIPESRLPRRPLNYAILVEGTAPGNEPFPAVSGNSSRRRSGSLNGRDPPGAENHFDRHSHRPFNIHGEFLDSAYSNLSIPNGNPSMRNAIPPIPNPVPAAPTKRPRGRPRKHSITDVPQKRPVTKIGRFETSASFPSQSTTCPGCKCRMTASTSLQHRCPPGSRVPLSPLREPSGGLKSPRDAPKRGRQSKGKERWRPEDEDDANDVEECDATSRLLAQPANRGRRGDDDDNNKKDDEKECGRPSQGAKKVELDAGGDDDEDLGDLDFINWMHHEPDVFGPYDPRLICGNVSGHSHF